MIISGINICHEHLSPTSVTKIRHQHLTRTFVTNIEFSNVKVNRWDSRLESSVQTFGVLDFSQNCIFLNYWSLSLRKNRQNAEIWLRYFRGELANQSIRPTLTAKSIRASLTIVFMPQFEIHLIWMSQPDKDDPEFSNQWQKWIPGFWWCKLFQITKLTRYRINWKFVNTTHK